MRLSRRRLRQMILNEVRIINEEKEGKGDTKVRGNVLKAIAKMVLSTGYTPSGPLATAPIMAFATAYSASSSVRAFVHKELDALGVKQDAKVDEIQKAINDKKQKLFDYADQQKEDWSDVLQK